MTLAQSAKLGEAFVLVSENKVGSFSKVTAVLAGRRINILAIFAQAAGGVAFIDRVADDASRQIKRHRTRI